jgi:hypothetical protein
MTKSQRNQDKTLVKEIIQCFKPSETISHDKKGWYYSEVNYIS